MKVLRVLHVVPECEHSPFLVHLLKLVPTEALPELGHSALFFNAYFLQRQWFSVFYNLKVFIVNGGDCYEPFQFFLCLDLGGQSSSSPMV